VRSLSSLGALLDRDPAQPFVTFYDHDTGERVELSAATAANWVAKTANLLSALGLEPGARVAVLLPVHWQASVVLLACWSVGAEVVLAPVDGPVGLTVAAADRLAEARRHGADDILALSLAPFGAPLPLLPAAVLDYAREVPGHADRFAGPVVDPQAPALSLAGRRYAADELTEAAHALAARHRLTAGQRLLSVLPYDTRDGLDAGLLAPVVAGAAVVLVRHADPTRLPALAANEHVTHTAGLTIADLPRLDG